MNKVFVLGRTQYDYNNLFTSTKQALSRNVNRVCDAKKLDKDVLKLYSVLGEILDPDYQHTSDMDGLPLLHYSYTLGVLTDSDTYQQLLEYGNISVMSQYTTRKDIMYLICTGTLRQWRDLVIDGASKLATSDIRQLMNEIYNTLSSEGLGRLWSNYSKLNYDNTMVLVQTT